MFEDPGLNHGYDNLKGFTKHQVSYNWQTVKIMQKALYASGNYIVFKMFVWSWNTELSRRKRADKQY